MKNAIDWIRRHRVAGIAIVIVYSALVILPHDVVQNPALKIQGQVGMRVWHFSILALLFVALLVFVVAIARRPVAINALPGSLKLQVTLLLVVTVAASTLLMVNSVEHIHYLQYFVMTLILGALLESILPAVLLAILIGVVDEGYQYFSLHPWQGYLDFNDIILDSIGAIWGGALLHGFWRERKISERFSGLDTSLYLLWTALFGIIILLISTGVFGFFAGNTGILLIRHAQPDDLSFLSRWITPAWGNSWFLLLPFEGLSILYVLPWILTVGKWGTLSVNGSYESG